MPAITVSRQLGSLGFEVAQASADLLGYRLVWRELINQAARQAGAPEAALAAIDDLGLLGICPSPEACQAYRQAVQQIMQDLARQSNVVIIGRAGQMILAGWADVLHIRVIAPLGLRIERVSERQSISAEHARAQVEASDRRRRNYIKRFYQVHWDDPNLYDLVINTAHLTPTVAAQLIAQTLANPQLLSHKPASPRHESTYQTV
jgi:cytidylate kinase